MAQIRPDFSRLPLRLTRTSLGVQGALLATLSLGATPQALAQTSYTATELKTPLGYGVNACDHGSARSLGDNGDVVGLCSYVAGYAYLPNELGPFPVPYSATRPMVWRAGKAATALSLPSGQDGKSFVGVTGAGRVLGVIGEIVRPNKTTTLPNALVWWEATGSTRTPFNPGAGNWVWSNLTGAGKLAGVVTGLQAGEAPRVVIQQGSSAQDLPLPPDVGGGSAALGNGSTAPGVALNDQGQIALLSFKQPASSEATAWVWNGSAWSALPSLPGPAPSRLSLAGLNTQGQVLLSSGGFNVPSRLHLWTPGSGWRTIEASGATDVAWVSGNLGPNGDIVGQATFPQLTNVANSGRKRAAIWRNGQHIDLNSLVVPPSGYVYSQILNINAKGQLLARMVSTSASSSRARLWVLTPR